MPRFGDYDELVVLEDTDLIVIKEVSSGTSKSVALLTLKEYAAGPASDLEMNLTETVATTLLTMLSETITDPWDLDDVNPWVSDYVDPSVLLLTSGTSDADASSYSTASITPKEYSVLVVGAVSSHATLDAPAITVSGLSGVTWAEETSVLHGAASSPHPFRLSVWTGICGATPGSGTVTIAATNSTSMKHAVLECIATDLTDPVVQNATAGSGSAAAVTGSVALSSSPADVLHSRSLGFFHHAANEATTPAVTVTGATTTTGVELVDNTSTAPVGGFEVQIRSRPMEASGTLASAAGMRSFAATWSTSSRWGSIAIELRDEI